MISLMVIGFFTDVTISFTSKKCRHTGNDVIMIIMKIQVDPFLIFRSRIQDGVLMFF